MNPLALLHQPLITLLWHFGLWSGERERERASRIQRKVIGGPSKRTPSKSSLFHQNSHPVRCCSPHSVNVVGMWTGCVVITVSLSCHLDLPCRIQQLSSLSHFRIGRARFENRNGLIDQTGIQRNCHIFIDQQRSQLQQSCVAPTRADTIASEPTSMIAPILARSTGVRCSGAKSRA